MSRAGSSRTAPPSRPSRRSATPRRSGCARPARTPPPRLAGSPSRSAPTSRVTGRVACGDRRSIRRRSAQRRSIELRRLAGSGDQRDPLARAARRSTPRARAGTAKIAPMLARTAFGECGSAQPGPSATRAAPNACARAQHRAHVPRIADAVQVHAQRPARRLGPALLVDADHARARAERRDGRKRVRARRRESPRRRASSRRCDSPRRHAGRPLARRRSGPRPRPRSVPLRSRSRLLCRRRTAFRRGLWEEAMWVM